MYHFFYSHKPQKDNSHVFSQWYPCQMTDDAGINYSSAEQYMMAQKALLFNDIYHYEKILNTTSPKTAKNLGRKVKDYDQKVWDNNKYQIVLQGNRYKFSQNEDLKKILLETGSKILAEASPYDSIWGIGFKESQALENQEKWGLNLLGKVLMDVRLELSE